MVNGNSRGCCSRGRKGEEVLDQKIAAPIQKIQNDRNATKQKQETKVKMMIKSKN
jgi:hypothetical protein